jgi:hypothetical protein
MSTSRLSSSLFAAFAALAFGAGAAHAATVTVNGKAAYGVAAPTASADYKLAVTPGKKWLNVNDGDTVEFDVGDKEFTWHFDTRRDPTELPLSAITPAGIDAGVTRVFVSKDPKTLN